MRVTHLNGLRAFETTLRTGSFRAAADELGVTPAAIGQQIRKLEDYLGLRLFLRTSAGVKPTEEALRVQGRLTSSFSVIDDIMVQLKGRRPNNRVSVTLPSSFAENWLTRHLADFYRLNSEVELRLDASNRMVDLVSEDFDFAIRYGPPPTEIYEERILFGDCVLPVCAPGFAERHQLSKKRESLEGVPLVHLKDRTPDPQWADWNRWGEAFGFDTKHMKTSLRFARLSSGLQAAIAGQGLVLCGITEAYNAIKDGLIVIPFGPKLNCPTGYQYRLLSIRGQSLSQVQRNFRNWIVETAEDFRQSVNTLLSTE